MSNLVGVTKKDAALIQLKRSIQLFLDEQDYICAITLAGAADEILGNLVILSGEKSSFALLKSRIASYAPGLSDKEIGDVVNFTRNSLKHHADKPSKVEWSIFTDLELEAFQLICRALTNATKLDTPCNNNEYIRFGKWLRLNKNKWEVG